MSRIVHRLIAKTAKDIAAEVFEVCSSNDAFHKQWPSRRRFIQCQWQEFLGYARLSLTTMLTPVKGTEKDPDGPKYYFTQHIRDEIFEALLIDGSHKTAPQKSIDQMRAEAGFDPLSAVRIRGYKPGAKLILPAA